VRGLRRPEAFAYRMVDSFAQLLVEKQALVPILEVSAEFVTVALERAST
jgi:hypothetical protein